MLFAFIPAAAARSFWSRALGQPETGRLVRPVCGVSAANTAGGSRTKRLLSRHRRRSGDDTARERELRLNTALVENTAVHRAHRPAKRAFSSRWSVVARENRRSGDHTSIRIHRSAPSTHTAMLAVALVTASSAAINNVRPLLDPLSLIGDAKATQRCGLRTY